MTTLRNGAGPHDPRPEAERGAADGTAADLAGLFHYPSLGRLLEGGDPRALEEMRGRLARTRQELERVVRQGTREEAERAARAERAVGLTLSLLDTLDGMRREGGAR
ncbi:MAG TPA: hypothetical protein VF736_09050 [Pyrinomonadaceae bacterium]|jgi:hypothetical protein